MINFIYSEFYRITHSRGTYAAAGLLAGLAIALNTALKFWGERYAITSFSYSNLVANPMVFAVMGAVVAFFLYEGSRKNGNIKNTVASGISRIKIFIGECIVSAVTSTIVMIISLAAWILSAELLLEKAGPTELRDLLMTVPSVYLIAIASMISCIVMLELFEKMAIGILLWFSIWFFIPNILMYLGLRFDTVLQIALWFPSNIFEINLKHVNMQECITVWDTAAGFLRCILSGVAIFTLTGFVSLRKKDL